MRTRRILQRAGLLSLAAFLMSGCFGGPCSTVSDSIIFTILFVGTVFFVGYGLFLFFS
jgi:hypothetical protein